MPERPRFRTTVWPGVLPPVTEVTALSPYLLVDDNTLEVDLEQAYIATVEVPDELYLRQLRDLDPDNPQHILDFVNSYGLLGNDPKDLFRLGLLTDVDVPRSALRPPTPTNEKDYVQGLEMELQLRIQESGFSRIETVSAWVRCFHSLIETYCRHTRGVADLDDLEGLATSIQLLLSPFSPVIRVDMEGEKHSDTNLFDERQPRLEHVLAMQLYRHLAAEDAYHVCANEPCGRLFVHQQGRSRHGQNRDIGVKYCSRNCAKAQAERERRRRRARERKT